MSFKTKILSLLLMGLLILPVLIAPQKGGNVLGVIESKSSSSQVAEGLGEIGGGTIEVKTVDPAPTTNSIISGKAIWDENAKSPVSSDKFSLGASIKVSSGNKSTSLVVGDIRVLSPDTLMVVDKSTYIKLGGDPTSDRPLDVSATLD
jgi:hypothetical protein